LRLFKKRLKLTIESVIAINLPPFYDRHGFEVLILSGPIRESCITTRHLNAVMTEQWLQALQVHTSIQQLTGKGMTQAMQRVALVS
jgi:hypothetical protein